MEIKYTNSKNKVVKRTIEAGMKWSEVKTTNKNLNSIFTNVDDGDGIVSECELDSINRILKEQDNNNNQISENGELETANLSQKTWEYVKNKVQVGVDIYNDIYAKNRFGMPTTGKNIDKHISMINKENVWTVIQVYNDKTEGKESLFSGIMGEIGLSMDERIKYAKHVFSKLKECYESEGIYADDLFKSFEKELRKQKNSWSPASAKNIDRIVKQLMQRTAERPDTAGENIAPNGKIDANFKQGRIGDCWLLGAIKAIANTPKGLKLLNDSVKVNNDGSVTVTLKGKNNSYTFSRYEIDRSSHLSTGDLDVRAIEMAVNKYITEEGGLYFYDDSVDIRDNYMMAAFEVLTGKSMSFWPFESNADKKLHPERYWKANITDKQIDNFNKPNHVACVTASRKPEIKVIASNGREGTIISNHAYAVIRSDDKYVYLVNPWDTSTEIPVDRKSFKQFFNTIQEMDL